MNVANLTLTPLSLSATPPASRPRVGDVLLKRWWSRGSTARSRSSGCVFSSEEEQQEEDEAEQADEEEEEEEYGAGRLEKSLPVFVILIQHRWEFLVLLAKV